MEETKLFWIAANKYEHTFPPVSEALRDPDGLLAAGGDIESLVRESRDQSTPLVIIRMITSKE